jgi:predicted metalloendopeptidase
MKVLFVSLLSAGAALALPNAFPRNAIVSNLNLSHEISPGDDFYDFVNKKWEDNAVIPPTESQISNFLFIHQVLNSN